MIALECAVKAVHAGNGFVETAAFTEDAISTISAVECRSIYQLTSVVRDLHAGNYYCKNYSFIEVYFFEIVCFYVQDL
eukprot:m.161312 g.161312  ORF g.161312 m.161312 type:complete len:78 (+) comp38815_c0_seq2:3122-3355(+)